MDLTLSEKKPEIQFTDNVSAAIKCLDKTLYNGAEIWNFRISWESEKVKQIEKPFVEFFFSIPQINMLYSWHPSCGFSRDMRVDWEDNENTMAVQSAPVYCLFDGNGQSRCTIAVSEALRNIEWNIGIHEEDASVLCRIRFPAVFFSETESYDFRLYRDFSLQRYEDALGKVREWWETKEDLIPLSTPESAQQPIYSTWYARHQEITADVVEKDCVEMAKLGMKAVILDDGWQTEDHSRGYAFCGDWQPAGTKFPDMRAHVRRVQKTGMKYLIWFSVPFIGKKASGWERFADKLLAYSEGLQAGILDPRYGEVRQYLIDTYTRTVREWGIDGLKLDFIDQFRAGKDSPVFCKGMDYTDVQTAVKRLMSDIVSELRKMKPDIMLEFRQRYIGPEMRKYGNMFRVTDCPGNPLANRVGTIDLRLLSGTTAVHSDPVVWHPEESCENAALHLLNVLFATVQFSVLPQNLSSRHRKMVNFWMEFMQKNEDLLQKGELHACSPEQLYPAVQASSKRHTILAIYQPHYIAEPYGRNFDDIILVTQTSHIKNGIRTLKNQYFRLQNTLMQLSASVPVHPAYIWGDAEQSWL